MKITKKRLLENGKGDHQIKERILDPSSKDFDAIIEEASREAKKKQDLLLNKYKLSFGAGS